ncbi:hypothetical protein [Variovorax sp. dw_954]|uniref:hypothetical protein n=1 Tax=Variovorax sp. dw_954 TaxID=2720078 RepID=UPI001BD64DB1|nr:hypothetical protein [Variovorax sp. dw_954]
MTLVPLPALADNYTWMRKRGPDAFEVHPGLAQPTLDTLGRGEPQLAAILDTHLRADPADPADRTTFRPMRPDARRNIHSILRIRESTLLEAKRAHAGQAAVASDAQAITAMHQWKSDFR